MCTDKFINFIFVLNSLRVYDFCPLPLKVPYSGLRSRSRTSRSRESRHLETWQGFVSVSVKLANVSVSGLNVSVLDVGGLGLGMKSEPLGLVPVLDAEVSVSDRRVSRAFLPLFPAGNGSLLSGAAVPRVPHLQGPESQVGRRLPTVTD